MLKFLHHLFTPHCPDCRAEAKEEKEELKLLRAENREEDEHNQVCESCQTLIRQLEIANAEKERLLDRLLAGPPKEERSEPVEVTRPRAIPWNLRRQMLESEDRRKAQLMRNAPKPDSAPEVKRADVAELEKELGVDDGAQVEEAPSKDTAAQN